MNEGGTFIAGGAFFPPGSFLPLRVGGGGPPLLGGPFADTLSGPASSPTEPIHDRIHLVSRSSRQVLPNDEHNHEDFISSQYFDSPDPLDGGGRGCDASLIYLKSSTSEINFDTTKRVKRPNGIKTLFLTNTSPLKVT